MIDDDDDDEPLDERPPDVERARRAPRVVPWAAALAVAWVALWGGWPFGTILACVGATVLASLSLAGAKLVSSDRRALGMLALLAAAGGLSFCVLSGIVMRDASPDDALALDRVVIAERAYLRHPRAGFLIGDPGPTWRRDDSVAGIFGLSWSLFGESRATWGWVGPSVGSLIVVSWFDMPAHPANADGASAVDTVGDVLHGMVSGAAHPGRTGHDEDVDERRYDEPGRREVWARCVGERGGEPIAGTARAIFWSTPDGELEVLAVVVTSPPQDDWRPFLLQMHAPGSSPDDE